MGTFENVLSVTEKILSLGSRQLKPLFGFLFVTSLTLHFLPSSILDIVHATRLRDQYIEILGTVIIVSFCFFVMVYGFKLVRFTLGFFTIVTDKIMVRSRLKHLTPAQLKLLMKFKTSNSTIVEFNFTDRSVADLEESGIICRITSLNSFRPGTVMRDYYLVDEAWRYIKQIKVQ